jgi:hypothetical protein
MNSKKPHKNNAVRFTCVLAAGTTCWVIFPLKQSMLGLSFEKRNSIGVKKELFFGLEPYLQFLNYFKILTK